MSTIMFVASVSYLEDGTEPCNTLSLNLRAHFDIFVLRLSKKILKRRMVPTPQSSPVGSRQATEPSLQAKTFFCRPISLHQLSR
mmetsp:Transcript_20207/g.29988  ORF Transcript_20207/g.29988 Transcript_20207/m.29988 type:complete len:84 (-) Transcript_20207:85-336(-)